MLEIKFKYRDDMSHGEWREQSCIMESLQECKEWYGLGVDCDYEIVSVKKVED